jgi:hypothetical protein
MTKPNITVIFSRHHSGGICNSDALYQIMEKVIPEVIFEELCEANFEKAHVNHTLNTLEARAVMMYQLSHQVKHLPVDTFRRPKNFDEKVDFMYDKLLNYAGEHSTNLKSFLDWMMSMVDRHGFPLLNSEDNEKIIEKRKELIQNALDFLDNDKLFDLAQMEQEVIEQREETILDNIYQYTAENHYSRGLMLIGSGHRKSILGKIARRSKTESLKVNWQYFLDLKDTLEA